MTTSSAMTGVLGLIIAIIAYADARTFPLQNLENGLGAAFFPLLIIGLLALLSLIALISGLARGESAGGLTLKSEGTLTAALMLLGLVLFAIAFGQFGLVVPAMVFIAGAAYLLGAPWTHAIVIGVIAGASVRVLFVNILNVYFF